MQQKDGKDYTVKIVIVCTLGLIDLLLRYCIKANKMNGIYSTREKMKNSYKTLLGKSQPL